MDVSGKKILAALSHGDCPKEMQPPVGGVRMETKVTRQGIVCSALPLHHHDDNRSASSAVESPEVKFCAHRPLQAVSSYIAPRHRCFALRSPRVIQKFEKAAIRIA